MNLHAMLLEREAAGRPVTVGLIGAGKFGTMFLAQARLDARHASSSRVADLDVARAREPARRRRLGRASDFGRLAWRRAQERRRTHVTRRCRGADRLSRDRGDRRGDRRSAAPASATRSSAIAHGKHIVMVNVEADARGGAAARAQGEGRGRRLQPRLGRSAGADLRARRLGARLRLQGDRRRQGHALRAALPPLHARHRLGHPRQISEHHGPQVDQPEDVQLVRRRHQVRHRDDGGVQRHRARAAERGLGLSAGDALRARRGVQAEGRRRHARERRRDRSRVVGLSRWARRAASSRARHLRGVRGRERIRAALLLGIRHAAGHGAGTMPRSTGRST